MSDFREYLNDQMQDPEFAQEWQKAEPERRIIHAIVDARINQGLSQAELARRCHMTPANLCRIENGNGNPSLRTLENIAAGLGKTLKIEFV